VVDGLNFRRGTTAQWAASTRILRAGEPGYDTDIEQTRIGDGVNLWANLPVLPNSSDLSASIAQVAAPKSSGWIDSSHRPGPQTRRSFRPLSSAAALINAFAGSAL
jgi:hypothetical protein